MEEKNKKLNKKLILMTFAVLGFVLVLVWILNFTLYKSFDKNLEVYFFNVGQGDSELIFQGGHTILIDGGPNASVISELSKALPVLNRKIDVIILTHPHADHVSGLVDVLQRYEVGAVVGSGVVYSTPEYNAFLEEIKNQKIPFILARAGEKIKIGDLGQLTILHPLDLNFLGKGPTNTHDSMVVARFDFGEESFLFMGDADGDLENELVSKGVDVRADVLKVGHHGSKNSSSLVFLKKVSPQISVIEVGKNNIYRHPADIALRNLAVVGSKIFRTDLNGTIKFLSDGFSLVYMKEF
ncbi:MAG: putative membrane spanning protein [Parcubacteria group bacterium GW2011_GWA2_39_18]|nr:MAG: putative membrane spanning protein [Parcubacteria group bacterium GW2011_GWA2_39_18]